MAESRAEIWVLAGVNGAGKSSVGGELLKRARSTWYDPDSVARELRAEGFSAQEANALAWRKGFSLLERAIAERRRYFFETTLGGNSITSALIEAARSGAAVRVWYCGLGTVDLHLKRIARRVREGGHDIPEARVRSRFDSSRLNLIRLLPSLAELQLLDNSAEQEDVRRARPRLLLHVGDGRPLAIAPLTEIPEWAHPIVAAATT